MTAPAAGRALPDRAASPPGPGGAVDAPPQRRPWRPRALVAAGLLVLIGVGLAVYADAALRSERIAALGASAEVDGGLGRVNGIIPLETDGWLPDDPPAVLTEPVADGSHRVRILLEVTVLDAEGARFDVDDWSILGLGAGRVGAIWGSPEAYDAQQGEVVDAVLVFEIPNQAIALTLEQDGGGRLALGVDHHTADR